MAAKTSMKHTTVQTTTAKSAIRKMPTVAKKTGTLHPQHVADKKASHVANRVEMHPNAVKTPAGNMPNRSEFHNHRVVKAGKHMATAGGVGKTTKRVPQEQATAKFVMNHAAKRRTAKKGM
jgi:hypothetical protein